MSSYWHFHEWVPKTRLRILCKQSYYVEIQQLAGELRISLSRVWTFLVNGVKFLDRQVHLWRSIGSVPLLFLLGVSSAVYADWGRLVNWPTMEFFNSICFVFCCRQLDPRIVPAPTICVRDPSDLWGFFHWRLVGLHSGENTALHLIARSLNEGW